MNMDTDVQLVARFKAGDMDAFAAIYTKYHGHVERICRHRLKDEHITEDAVQGTFEVLLRRLTNFQGGERLVNYIARTAKFQCMSRSGARLRAVERLSPFEVDPGGLNDNIGDAAAAVLDTLNVRRIFLELRPDQSAMLRAHHMEGRPLAELAETHGATPKSMSVRLHRARQAAKRIAERHDIG